jgi:hypothetical protein
MRVKNCVLYLKEKTMDKLDRMISEALDDEEREILEKIGHDQSFWEQVFGLFRGGMQGWMNRGIFLLHVVCAVSGIYAAWKFFNMSDVLEAIRWGLPAAVLLLAALILRLTLLRTMLTNNVLHAVKHLEMQIALLITQR